jgi:glyoxylase-like metal-dependent hydrolase (beta-lactamase superfamily II)
MTPVAAGLGIQMLEVPTPFAVGAVNAYLLEGSPLTLIDTGPNLATSLVALEQALGGAGYRVEDLELLVVTHQHVDHLGLTQMLADRAGAEVAFLREAAPFVEDYEARQRADDEYAEIVMLRHGIDEPVVDALKSVATIIRGFGAPVAVTRPLVAGSEIVMGDRTYRVLRRPGHSPSDTVFYEEGARLLISGDHLLSKISSNALETRPLDPEWDGSRTHPLVDYRRSLLETRALDVDLVLGGHGPPIDDHRRLIDERLSRQTERAEHILDLLRPAPRSGHEIANVIWGRVAFTQAYLTLCEVLGHVDLLIEAGAVAEYTSGEVVTFEAL